jgi:tetratricopeptide (TPR) repeat protein
MVELRLRGSAIRSIYSDVQGQFSFASLFPNSYQVFINDDEYYPAEERANISSEDPNIVLQINLRPREKATKDLIPPRPSGGNPFLVDPADYNKRFPKKAVKEYQKGLENEQNGKQDEAISHYLDALKIAPDYYPAHNNLGSLYLGRHDFKSAEGQFREAIRLDQNDSQAYFNLGNLYLLTQRYPDAEAELALGLQRRPDSAFGHFLEGSLSSRTGHYPEAEKDLREALRLDPGMWQAHLQLVNIYVQQKRRDDAIRELQAFLKDSPNSPVVPNVRELLKKLQTQNTSAQQ